MLTVITMVFHFALVFATSMTAGADAHNDPYWRGMSARSPDRKAAFVCLRLTICVDIQTAKPTLAHGGAR